jgi:hypothetical protein
MPQCVGYYFEIFWHILEFCYICLEYFVDFLNDLFFLEFFRIKFFGDFYFVSKS